MRWDGWMDLGVPRGLWRTGAAAIPLLAALLLTVLAPLLGGCARTRYVEVTVSEALNPPPDLSSAQPLLIGLYQLSDLPPKLEIAETACTALDTTETTAAYLKKVLLDEEPALFSLTPGQDTGRDIDKIPGTKWLLVVPYFERDCPERDEWALYRVWPTTRSFGLHVEGTRLELPWERPGRRQRGCVEGRPQRFPWSVCQR